MQQTIFECVCINGRYETEVDGVPKWESDANGYVVYRLVGNESYVNSMQDMVTFELNYLNASVLNDNPIWPHMLLKRMRLCANLHLPVIAHRLVDFSRLTTDALGIFQDQYLIAQSSDESALVSEGIPENCYSADHREEGIKAGYQLATSILNERSKEAIKALPHSGYVYLIKSVTGYWKIGRTANPNDRIKTFSVKLPFEVEYEHLIPCADYVAAEIELHQKFAHKRANGEWFQLDASDVAWIKAIKYM